MAEHFPGDGAAANGFGRHWLSDWEARLLYETGYLAPPDFRVLGGSELSVGNGRKRFIYLGDGSGDYCPSLRLAREDFMMPRKGFPVWDLICENPCLLQAEVHPWSDGQDMEDMLLRLVGRVLVEESKLLTPLDRKLETMPVVAVQDGMPMPLGVKN